MLLLLPEILVSFLALSLLVLLCISPNKTCTKTICIMAYVLILSGIYFTALASCGSNCIVDSIFHNNYIIDKLAYGLKGILILGSGIIILYIKNYLIAHNLFKTEFFALFILSILGQIICISAAHMLLTYLGIELMALSIYGLAAFNYSKQISIEAAIKYMVLGAIASAFLLYGISMVYGATGSLVYSEIFNSIADKSYNSTIMLLGVIFIIAALAFKLGLVPFHMWAPDVYEGSNNASVLILSTLPKIAIAALFYRLFSHVFYDISGKYIMIFQVIAISSLFVANLTAIMQKNIKRMLAYSTISQLAFVLLAFISSYDKSNLIFAVNSGMFYTVIYVFSAMAVFSILLGLTSVNDDLTINDLKGLAKKNPLIGFGLLICMFSLAGIPPTIGFYAKLLVIQSLVHTHNYILAILAVVSSVIAAFYYLRIVKVIYFDEITEKLPEFIQTKSAKLFMLLNLCLLLALGIYPKALIGIFQNIIY